MDSPLAILSEPRREQILRMVWHRERSAGEIAGAMPVTFGAVSQHLAILREAGLVRLRKEGRKRWYIADRERLGPLAAALEQMWFGKLQDLKALAEAEESNPPTSLASQRRRGDATPRRSTRRHRDGR